MKNLLVCLVAVVAFVSVGICGEKPSEGVGLTIYNDNFAVVRENRIMGFEKGLNTVKFTDVASAIDPTTMKFEALSSPGKISILEQNYEYDLVSKQALLLRSIDKHVSVTVKGSGSDPIKKVSGVLAAYTGGNLVIKYGEVTEIISESSVESIMLAGKQFGDLVTKPTLVWLANSKVAGDELVRVTYTTEAISWKADYTAVLSEDDKMLDLSGWVTITNNSGAGYENANIKLMAGDVRRITRPQYGRGVQYEMMAMDKARSAGFEEKAFAEYHLYTLGRTSTINNNQIKQIELIDPAEDVPAVKKYIFERQRDAKKVQVKIEFDNLEEHGLGIAMPKGKVRVFKADSADGTLEFIGEDQIDHTPRKETLSLYIGNAFDIVPEYKLLESQLGPNRGDYHWRKEKHEVELRNRKDEDITVYVDEKFYSWPNFTIDETTHEYEKIDARTVRFKVDIKADATETLTYSTTQTW